LYLTHQQHNITSSVSLDIKYLPQYQQQCQIKNLVKNSGYTLQPLYSFI